MRKSPLRFLASFSPETKNLIFQLKNAGCGIDFATKLTEMLADAYQIGRAHV